MRRPLRSDLARRVADLAVELGDPGRMARARRLYRAGTVNGLDVAPGHLEAGVYEAGAPQHSTVIDTLEQPSPGELPSADAITARCTCDDDATACVHVLATVLSFAEEVEVAPELIGDWTAATKTESPSSGDDEEFFASSVSLHRTPLPPLPRAAGSPDPLDGVMAIDVVDDARRAVAQALSFDDVPRSRR